MTFRISIILLIITSASCLNYSRVTRQLAKNKTKDFRLPFKSSEKINESNLHPYNLLKTRIEFVKLAEQYIKNLKPYYYIQYKPYNPPTKTYNYNKDYINKILNSLNLLHTAQNQTQAISSTTESAIVSSSEQPFIIENVTLANMPPSTTDGNNNMETTVTSVKEAIPAFESTTLSFGMGTTEELIIETTKKFETATVNIKEGATNESMKETADIIENTTNLYNNSDLIKQTTTLPLNWFGISPFEELPTMPITANFQTSSAESGVLIESPNATEELPTESWLHITTTSSPISESSSQYYESILEASTQVEVESTTQASLIIKTTEEAVKLNYESTTKSIETSTNLNITEIGTITSVKDIFTTEETLNSLLTESTYESTEINEDFPTMRSVTEKYYSSTPSSLTTILYKITEITANSTTDSYTTPSIWSINTVTSSEETTTEIPKLFTLETVTKLLQKTTENVYDFLTTSTLSTQGDSNPEETTENLLIKELATETSKNEIKSTTNSKLTELVQNTTTERFEAFTTESSKEPTTQEITDITKVISNPLELSTINEVLTEFPRETLGEFKELRYETTTGVIYSLLPTEFPFATLTEENTSKSETDLKESIQQHEISAQKTTTELVYPETTAEISVLSTIAEKTTESISNVATEIISEAINEPDIAKVEDTTQISKNISETTINVPRTELTTEYNDYTTESNFENKTEAVRSEILSGHEITPETPISRNSTEMPVLNSKRSNEQINAELFKEPTTQEIIDITTVISNPLEVLNINEVFTEFPRETLGEFKELRYETTTGVINSSLPTEFPFATLTEENTSKSETDLKESIQQHEINAQKTTTELVYPETTAEISVLSTIAEKTTEATNEPDIAKVEDTTQMSKNISETTINVPRSELATEYNDYTTESNFENKTEALRSQILSGHEITPGTPISRNSTEMPVLNSKRSNEQINSELFKEPTTQEIIDITTVISNPLEVLNINEVYTEFPRETLGEFKELRYESTTGVINSPIITEFPYATLTEETTSKSETEFKESIHQYEISAKKTTSELVYPGTTTEIPVFSTIAEKTTESISNVATEIISEVSNAPEIAKVEYSTQMAKNISETTINVPRSELTNEYNDYTTESNFENKTEAVRTEISSGQEITPVIPISRYSTEKPLLNSKRSNEQKIADDISARFLVDELSKRNSDNRQNERSNRKAKKLTYDTDVMPSLGDYDII